MRSFTRSWHFKKWITTILVVRKKMKHPCVTPLYIIGQHLGKRPNESKERNPASRNNINKTIVRSTNGCRSYKYVGHRGEAWGIWMEQELEALQCDQHLRTDSDCSTRKSENARCTNRQCKIFWHHKWAILQKSEENGKCGRLEFRSSKKVQCGKKVQCDKKVQCRKKVQRSARPAFEYVYRR